MSSVDQHRCKNVCNYNGFIFYIKESELDSLRLGREFGSVKLYSDNIRSARSISLFSGAYSVDQKKNIIHLKENKA